MTIQDAELVIDDLSLPEVEQRWGINRTSVKNRAKALGVQLIRESSTRTVWPGDALALGDALHHHLKTGGTTKTFNTAGTADSATSADTAKPVPAQPSAGSSAITGPSADSQMLALATALATAMREQQPIPEADPLTRARQLREMEREGLLLTGTELSQVLGIEVDSALHKQERFGYKFTRQPTNGKNKWVWSCHRTAGSGATALTADTGNSAGTGGTWTPMGGEPLAARQLINVTPTVQLPGFIC